MRDRATELEMRKSVKATKLRMLNLRRGNLQPLATGEQDPAAEIAAIEHELATIVEEHMEVKASLATLDYSFEQIKAVLGEPARYLGLNTTALRVSHTGYKLDAGASGPAAELRLNELWIGSNLHAVIVPVYVPRPTPARHRLRRASLSSSGSRRLSVRPARGYWAAFGCSCDCGVTSGMVLARPASIIASSFVSICNTRAVLTGESTLVELADVLRLQIDALFLHVEIPGGVRLGLGVGHRFEVLGVILDQRDQFVVDLADVQTILAI